MPEVTTQPPPARLGALPRRLYDRFGHLLHELGKFGVVGAVAYVVDLGIFLTCEGVLNLSWLPSAVISMTVAATVAFVGNRFWTWRDRPRTGLGREYALFFLFNAVGLGISLAVLWLTHDVLGAAWPAFRSLLADTLSKQVVGMVLGTAFRFWAYRRYVFPHAPLDAAGRLAEETEPGRPALDPSTP